MSVKVTAAVYPRLFDFFTLTFRALGRTPIGSVCGVWVSCREMCAWCGVREVIAVRV